MTLPPVRASVPVTVTGPLAASASRTKAKRAGLADRIAADAGNESVSTPLPLSPTSVPLKFPVGPVYGDVESDPPHPAAARATVTASSRASDPGRPGPG